MLRLLTKKILDFRAWIVSGAFLLAVGWIISSSKPFEGCIEKEYREGAAENLEKGISQVASSFAVYRDCLGHFTHDNAEAIIAAFTILIALATIFLWAATRDLVRSAEKTAERQLRAYVGLSEVTIENMTQLFARQDFEVHFVLTNNGQTPAYNVISYGEVAVASAINPELPAPTGTPHMTTIGPGVSNHKWLHKTPLTSAEIAGIQNGSMCLYAYVDYRYKDAFGKTRNTRCRTEIGGRAGWRPTGAMANSAEGNYAD
jgi:hypothetical protein